MATRVHRPLKVVAFNANGIGRQRYELSKQLQEQRIDVALLSETHLKSHKRFYVPNYQVYRTDRIPGIKGGTAVAVKKGIPHSHADLPPLNSLEATGVCIPIGNSELLVADVYKSLGKAWRDADIIELLNFRRKSVLAYDRNIKHPFWNSAVSNPSGKKLLDLFDTSDFETSAPQYCTHYSPAGNGDLISLSIKTSVCHKSLSLTSWTQITYQ
jgi:hypothetical protein